MNTRPLFKIGSVSPSPTLLGRIVLAIHRKQEQARLWRVRTFAGSAMLSVVALVPVIHSLIVALKASNFGVYMSLVFSDGGMFLSFWREIGASLIESLPVIAVAATLALIGFSLWSVRNMVRFMNNKSLRGLA